MPICQAGGGMPCLGENMFQCPAAPFSFFKAVYFLQWVVRRRAREARAAPRRQAQLPPAGSRRRIRQQQGNGRGWSPREGYIRPRPRVRGWVQRNQTPAHHAQRWSPRQRPRTSIRRRRAFTPANRRRNSRRVHAHAMLEAHEPSRRPAAVIPTRPESSKSQVHELQRKHPRHRKQLEVAGGRSHTLSLQHVHACPSHGICRTRPRGIKRGGGEAQSRNSVSVRVRGVRDRGSVSHSSDSHSTSPKVRTPPRERRRMDRDRL